MRPTKRILLDEAVAICVEAAGKHEARLVCAFELNLERYDAFPEWRCGLEDLEGEFLRWLVVAVLLTQQALISIH